MGNGRDPADIYLSGLDIKNHERPTPRQTHHSQFLRYFSSPFAVYLEQQWRYRTESIYPRRSNVSLIIPCTVICITAAHARFVSSCEFVGCFGDCLVGSVERARSGTYAVFLRLDG